MNEIKNLQLQGYYVHKKHNTIYRITAYCKVKLEDGRWVDGIIYVNPNNETFCCSVKSFTERFRDA